MTEEHLTRRGADKVQHVEMFLFTPRVRGLSLFVSLSSLSIMQQQLTHIEGLDACVRLKHLWVVEVASAIEGLDACVNLERLYLYGNRIGVGAGPPGRAFASCGCRPRSSVVEVSRTSRNSAN